MSQLGELMPLLTVGTTNRSVAFVDAEVVIEACIIGGCVVDRLVVEKVVTVLFAMSA